MGNEESKPMSGKGLSYKPLKAKRNQIRIIKFKQRRPEEPHRLNLSLCTVSLDKKPAYHCLSYVWGKPEFTWPISVNGALVHITPALGEALSQLEHESNLEALWADGICINQSDTAERENQVKLMARIYGECQASFAWLGPGDDKLHAAMHLLNTTGVRIFRSMTTGYVNHSLNLFQKAGSQGYIVDPEAQNQVMRFRDAIKLAGDHDTRDAFAIDADHRMLTRETLADVQEGTHHIGEQAFFQMRNELFLPAARAFEDIITAWERLMGCPFWRRIWIVQELVQPDVVMLRCGSASARLDYLHSVRNFVFETGHTPQDPIPGVDDFAARHNRMHTCLTNPANSLHFIANARQKRFSDVKSVESWDTIHVMLRQCWQLQSTKNLDKVYGLMNIATGDTSELRDLMSYSKSIGQLGMEVMRMTLIRHGLKHLQEGLWFYYPMDPETLPDETKYTALSPYWPSWMNISDALFSYPGAQGPLFLIHEGRSEILFKQYQASSGYKHKVEASDFGSSNLKLPFSDILRVPCRIIGEVKRVCDLSIRTWSEDMEDYETAQLAMGHAIIEEVESFFNQENDLESMLHGKPLWWLFSLQPDEPFPNPSPSTTEVWRENMQSYKEQFLALKNKTPHPNKCIPHRALLIKWIQTYSPISIDTGYVGIGPQQSGEGDKVVIFPDVDVPYVLRPWKGGFKLLGQAYVLGIMNGEFLRTDPPETLIILM